MRKIIWSSSNKSNVAVFRGEDKDIFIGFEGGVPIRARELLTAFYKAGNNMRELEHVKYLLTKAEKKWFNQHKDMLEDWKLVK